MDLHDIHDLAGRLGVALSAEGERVIARPGSAVTEELAAGIRDNKKALLVELRMVEKMAKSPWVAGSNGGAKAWMEKRGIQTPAKAKTGGFNTHQTAKGFRYLEHGGSIVVQESSFASTAVGEKIQPADRHLWIAGAHLSRERVDELIGILQAWVDDGRLPELREEGETG